MVTWTAYRPCTKYSGSVRFRLIYITGNSNPATRETGHGFYQTPLPVILSNLIETEALRVEIEGSPGDVNVRSGCSSWPVLRVGQSLAGSRNLFPRASSAGGSSDLLTRGHSLAGSRNSFRCLLSRDNSCVEVIFQFIINNRGSVNFFLALV